MGFESHLHSFKVVDNKLVNWLGNNKVTKLGNSKCDISKFDTSPLTEEEIKLINKYMYVISPPFQFKNIKIVTRDINHHGGYIFKAYVKTALGDKYLDHTSEGLKNHILRLAIPELKKKHDEYRLKQKQQKERYEQEIKLKRQNELDQINKALLESL